jgi:predicted permease
MAWHNRLRDLFRQERLADEIDEELQFHVESSVRANVAAGMTLDEARRDAARRFGNRFVIREDTRDARVMLFADNLRQDVAFAIRALRRRPAFAALALFTLALGIGATTAIFTVVHSVLLRPLPFANPDALYAISHVSPGPAWLYPGMSDEGYLKFREANRTFESLTTFARAQSTLTGAGDAVRLTGAAVTADFFNVLGINAASGRTFRSEDGDEGAEKIVLLSDSLWKNRFGASPTLLGQTVTLDGIRHRVVGILPSGFSYPADASYWTPLTVRVDPHVGYIRPVLGRTRPGVTREKAQADLDLWASNLPPDPNRSRDVIARVTPLHDAIVGDVRLPVLVFGGAVLLVLLIVCANVANLLLMRAVSRRQEIATRLALGAARGRLARQLLTESALLSIAGGLAGTAVAVLAGPAILSAIPAGRLPHDIVIRVDGWVLAFTAGLSILTGLIVGATPLVQIARDTQFHTLREGRASATLPSHRLRQALVVAQMALTLTLLVGAGLLVKSFITLRSVPLGFAPQRVMTMTVSLPESRYPTVTEATLLYDRLLESLGGISGVTAAGAVNWLPLGNLLIRGDIQAEDRPDLIGKYRPIKAAISPDYFKVMGMRPVRGRTFTARDDRTGQGVLIISESVARRLWPGGDPIGKRMTLEDRPQPQDWLTIVGVVEDVRQGGFRAAPAHTVYQPYPQVKRLSFVDSMTLLVRTESDPVDVAAMMRTALKRLDDHAAPEAIAALETIVDRTVAEPKFEARAIAAFAIVALLLAAVGIYGVLASSVLERQFEIGVRMALGADRRSVVRMVLNRTMVLTAIGVVLGYAGSLALTGSLRTLLFNVAPTDATAFAGAAFMLIAVALVAALVPARRAASVDPLVALRAE